MGKGRELMAVVRSFRDLIAWQKGMDLVRALYRVTKNMDPSERFGLTNQMRRAAVSIPSNIAEGQARHTTGEFIQFISHAEGSVAELDTQLILSIELKLCRDVGAKAAFEMIAELRRMLNVLRRKLAARH